jgi:thioesterase domain-containing protein
MIDPETDDWERMMQLGTDGRLSYILAHARMAGLISSEMDLPQFRSLFNLFEHNILMIPRYEPKKYVGEVTLLKATEKLEGTTTDVRDWSELAENVEIHLVPGDHFNIIHEPHVKLVAETLRTCFDKLQVKG